MRFNAEYLRSKLARRIFALFFGAALLPLLIITSLSFQKVSQLILNERTAQLKQDNKHLSQVTYERLTNIQSKLQSILFVLRAERELPFEIKTLMHDYISVAAIVDSRSGLTVDLIGNSQHKKLPELNIQKISTTASTLFTYAGDRSTQADIYFAQKVHLDKQSSQFLLVKVRHDYLWPSDQLPFETQVSVFDDQGRMLQPQNDLEIKPDQFASWLRPDFENQSAIKVGDDDYLVNRRSLFMDAQFNSKDWRFIGVQPYIYAVSDLSQFRNYFIPPILLSLALISFVCLIMIRRNLNPVERLLKGTKQVALNNFEHQIEIQSNDEFGVLAESFNSMTARLKHQFDINRKLSEIDHLILENATIDEIAATVISGLDFIIPAQEVCLVLIDSEIGRSSVVYVLPNKSDFYCKHDIDSIDIASIVLAFSSQNQKIRDDKSALNLRSLLIQKDGFAHFIPIMEENHAYGLLIAVNQAPIKLDKEAFTLANEYAGRVSVALAAQNRNRRLVYQANIDSLTNIPNRRQMEKSVNEAIRFVVEGRFQQGALIFIDLDRFKHVNDAYGHPVGDQLLIQAANRLSDCLESNQVVARFGGDEFAILMPNILDVLQVEQLAKEVIETLSLPFRLDPFVSYVGASAGIALFPDNADNFDELLQKTDTAMYIAKNAGRNQFAFYQQDMGVNSLKRSTLEHEIRIAIDNDAFEVYYQPKVCATTGSIKGFEALLRWQHETIGYISPADVIPIAEESDLIIELGDWVLLQVCNQVVAWQGLWAKGLVFSVNASSIQVMSDGYLDRLKAIIQKSGVDPNCLEIEITEGLFLNDQKATTLILEQVHDLGVKIAVDDFGTGFSSLGYLSQLPIDTLKIDRCFIELMSESEKDKNLVKTIVAMANNLHLNVVAEGVETKEELIILREFFHGQIQGYFFSKPLHVHGVEEMILNENRFALKIESAIESKLSKNIRQVTV